MCLCAEVGECAAVFRLRPLLQQLHSQHDHGAVFSFLFKELKGGAIKVAFETWDAQDREINHSDVKQGPVAPDIHRGLWTPNRTMGCCTDTSTAKSTLEYHSDIFVPQTDSSTAGIIIKQSASQISSI